MPANLQENVNSALYGEGNFVKDLNDDEMSYLNTILEKEIKYAQNEQDQQRASELNEVYELLF